MDEPTKNYSVSVSSSLENANPQRVPRWVRIGLAVSGFLLSPAAIILLMMRVGGNYEYTSVGNYDPLAGVFGGWGVMEALLLVALSAAYLLSLTATGIALLMARAPPETTQAPESAADGGTSLAAAPQEEPNRSLLDRYANLSLSGLERVLGYIGLVSVGAIFQFLIAFNAAWVSKSQEYFGGLFFTFALIVFAFLLSRRIRVSRSA